jgi:hypothetical protein
MKEVHALSLWLTILIALCASWFGIYRTGQLQNQLERLEKKHETDLITVRVAIERALTRRQAQPTAQPGRPLVTPPKSPEKF